MKKVLEAERALSAEKARGFEMANESCGKTREQKKKKKLPVYKAILDNYEDRILLEKEKGRLRREDGLFAQKLI